MPWWVYAILILILLVCVEREHFDLSAAFIDLATYDSLDRYMYRSFIRLVTNKVTHYLRKKKITPSDIINQEEEQRIIDEEKH
jgi:hypothetical protein